MELEKQTLTIDEAAKVLGVGRNKAYEAAHRGEIPREAHPRVERAA